jgi:hypothetical protein
MHKYKWITKLSNSLFVESTFPLTAVVLNRCAAIYCQVYREALNRRMII